MDVGIFIKKINKGHRNFDSVVIDEVINPDLIE